MTYFTSPMGADHTAGLTYRMPRTRHGQTENSLKFQIRAAACDAFGYCLNSVPGSRSVYPFFADLMNARYGLHLTPDDIMEVGKQTLRDQLAFNEKAEFGTIDPTIPAFLREERITPTDSRVRCRRIGGKEPLEGSRFIRGKGNRPGGPHPPAAGRDAGRRGGPRIWANGYGSSR